MWSSTIWLDIHQNISQLSQTHRIETVYGGGRVMEEGGGEEEVRRADDCFLYFNISYFVFLYSRFLYFVILYFLNYISSTFYEGEDEGQEEV